MSEQARAICERLLVEQARRFHVDLDQLRSSASAEAVRSIDGDLRDGIEEHVAAEKLIRNLAESLADDPFGIMREDLAPVWQPPDPQRIDRLHHMVEELEYHPEAAGFTALLQQGRYVEVVEALLVWLCERAQQAQSEFDSSMSDLREYRRALKIVAQYAAPEELEAAAKSAEMKVDHETGPLHWAEFHPLVSHRVGGEDYEPTAGRNPEWIKRNLGAALMNVLLVAGYDKAERNSSYQQAKTLNKRTAADRARRMAGKYGIRLSKDALERAPLDF